MEDLNLDPYIRKVPDFPKKGILFYDITSLINNPRVFAWCIDKMVDLYKDTKIDAVAAIETRGFLFAAPYALRRNIPLILIRKKGKLPGKTLSKKYELEYNSAEIELQPDDVKAGQQVLLTDDLIATGGTLEAARDLLVEAGAQVPEIFGLVGLPFLGYEPKFGGTPVTTLINYSSE
ncbi:MAG: adenine phosphoribosyltransferase [Spirochaetaceae bacterium]|jgi:adenine phosphoribosyltransferase|nr:adenine phosphoribosyltransferase [Spirochaetaceae bacterium]